MPRSFYSCSSDETDIKNLIHGSMFHHSDSKPYVVGMDLESTCDEFGYIVDSAREDVRCSRDVVLHTLHNGSLNVQVIDLNCTICGRLIPYEGSYNALFSSRK